MRLWLIMRDVFRRHSCVTNSNLFISKWQHFTWLLELHWAAPLHCHWWHSVEKRKDKLRIWGRRVCSHPHTHTHTLCEVECCCVRWPSVIYQTPARWNLTCKMASSVTFCWGEKEEKNFDKLYKRKWKIWREMKWEESFLPLWSQSPHRNLPDSLPVEHFVSSGDARLFCSVRIEKSNKYQVLCEYLRSHRPKQTPTNLWFYRLNTFEELIEYTVDECHV